MVIYSLLLFQPIDKHRNIFHNVGIRNTAYKKQAILTSGETVYILL